MTEKQVRHYLNEETGKIEEVEIETPTVSSKPIQKIADLVRSGYEDSDPAYRWNYTHKPTDTSWGETY